MKVDLIEAPSAAGQQAGLHIDTALSCENLYTVRQDVIVRNIGTLPDSLMPKVAACLKASLELPRRGHARTSYQKTTDSPEPLDRNARKRVKDISTRTDACPIFEMSVLHEHL